MSEAIEVLAEKCVSCRICEQWCAFSHGRPIGPAMSAIRIKREHHEYTVEPIVCNQCAGQEPKCVQVCPFGALSRAELTGAIIVDEQACQACRLCVSACPIKAVQFDSISNVVRICDLCGGNPQCVAHCPEKALLYIGTAVKNSQTGGQS